MFDLCVNYNCPNMWLVCGWLPVKLIALAVPEIIIRQKWALTFHCTDQNFRGPPDRSWTKPQGASPLRDNTYNIRNEGVIECLCPPYHFLPQAHTKYVEASHSNKLSSTAMQILPLFVATSQPFTTRSQLSSARTSRDVGTGTLPTWVVLSGVAAIV